MNGRNIRLGIVGLGLRGSAMFRLAAGFDGVEPVAACDLDASRWTDAPAGERPFAERFPDAIFCLDFDAMLAGSALDAVMIETPADRHAEFCGRAMEAGVAVFSDIPTVANLDEATRLWEIAERRGSFFMTGANPNEWGFVEALCDLHRQGLLGKPYYLEAEYIHDTRGLWAKTPWRGNYPPIRYCTHSLGPLLRILPEDLRTVSCVGTGSQVTGLEGKNDLMTAHFTTDSGAVVRLTVSFINQAGCGYHSYRVFGTEGYFERLSERGSQPARTLFNTNRLYGMKQLTELPVGTQRHELAAEGNAAAGHGGADYALLASFFAALREGRPPPIDLRDGLRMTLPGLYAAESARRGGALLTLRYPWDAD